jgi:flagellar basal-body rod modification protein FlgD
MEMTGISQLDPAYGASPSGGTAPSGPSSKLDKSAFVKLLVTQMRNQDPLAPGDSTQYVAQLAQFSSLEQMQNLNDNLVGLAALQQNNALLAQLTQSSALIGKAVDWTDPDTGVAHSGQVTAVKLQDGAAFLEVGGHDVPLAYVSEVHEAPEDAGTESDGGGDDSGDGT